MDPRRVFVTAIRLFRYCFNRIYYNHVLLYFVTILLTIIGTYRLLAYCYFDYVILASIITAHLYVQMYNPHWRDYFRTPTLLRVDMSSFTEIDEADLTKEDLCPICLQSISEQRCQFAHLEHCDHIFCESCLLEWRTRRWSCPLCKTLSTRWLLHSQCIDNEDDKKVIFATSENVFYF